ncbi:histidine--tRNA ligase [Halobacillus sp. ACCC02827]|uniref:histidine--tRNA ligase n=1 Tax=Halobacillus sp. ACCC02827 TaxID=3052090 RepID=UPI002570C2F7|nr:histidine--tRNA ligase [Halobacillus sp. ACCC02827]WJE17177.1 histidine--tRNA ligase [Halobacillus sp. ACCC02827]
MKKMNYQNVKGTQDYIGREEVVKRNIKRTLEDVFIQYGCKPLETPILNYTELLASKYGGGSEILEEMYTLSDRGERDLALRYDLTIPFAKVVAMNPTLRMPFKRYEIGKVFRDGPIKEGRYREFTQCDVDIVGVDSQIAEAELMSMALEAFNRLKVDVTIQYNNRKLLVGMLKEFGLAEEMTNKVILVLDKLEKIGVNAVISELVEKNLSSSIIDQIRTFLTDERNTTFSYFESIAKRSEMVNQGLNELRDLESYLDMLGVETQCIFNPFLARGLEIYTGTIYEIFLADKSINSSIGSGGRYNNAVSGLMETNEEFPTVGISFGLDVIYAALSKADNIQVNSDIDYYIIPLGKPKESLLVADKFRKQGFKIELELGNKKLGKALDKANKENIPNVIIIGEEEVKNNELKMKNMDSGIESIEPFRFV